MRSFLYSLLFPSRELLASPIPIGKAFWRAVPALLVLFGMLFCILLAYRRMEILFILILIHSIYVLARCHNRRAVATFIVAAILGPLGEYTMIRMNYWDYNMETWNGIPLWLPLVWGNLFVSFNELAELSVGLLSGRGWFERFLRPLIGWGLALGIFLYLYIAGRMGVAMPFLLAFAVLHLFTLRFFTTRETVAAALWSTLIGVTGEVVCTLADVWVYHKAVLGLIPLTLPLAWGYSGVIIRWAAGFPLASGRSEARSRSSLKEEAGCSC